MSREIRIFLYEIYEKNVRDFHAVFVGIQYILLSIIVNKDLPASFAEPLALLFPGSVAMSVIFSGATASISNEEQKINYN